MVEILNTLIYNVINEMRRNMYMKNNLLFKTISVLLCIVMLSALPLSAYAASDSVIPVIFVTDIIANDIVEDVNDSQSDTLFPPSNDEINGLIKQFIATYFASSQNNHNLAIDTFMDRLGRLMEPLSTNPDGSLKYADSTARDYSYNPYTYLPAPMSLFRNSQKTLDKVFGAIGQKLGDRIGDENVFAFTYDWRIDPIENAAKLDQYIKDVKSLRGVAKVTLVAEGFGGIITTAYLDKYAQANNFADIQNYVMVNSYFQGLGLVGDVFTGNIMIRDSAFIRYLNDQPENAPVKFALWLTQAILNENWEIQEFARTLNNSILLTKAKIYNHYVKDIIKTVPGLWALVPAAQYEQAKEYLHTHEGINPQPEPMNPVLEAKVDAYHEIQVAAPEILKKLKASGAGVALVAGYNLQIFPITKDSATNQSDGMVDTVYASAGADCLELNANLVDIPDYFNKHNVQLVETGYNNISLDRFIDASTCALPQNTWFIKNLKHNGFRYDSNSPDFIVWLVLADNPTVWSSVKYPQYMTYSVLSKKLSTGATKWPDGLKLGDVNLDGKVTAADARLVLRLAAKLDKESKYSELALKNADIDLDGKITTADARMILRIAAKLSPTE